MDGFTFGELADNTKLTNEECRRFRTELLRGEVLIRLDETRDDSWGSSQAIYVLSFNGRSQVLADQTCELTGSIHTLTFLMVILVMIQVFLAVQQGRDAELAGRAERIGQLQMIQSAVDRCRESPELEDSGLADTSSGEVAPCKDVLKAYGSRIR